MKTGQCRCGNRVYFNNTHCLKCQSTLGYCTTCKSLSSFTVRGESAVCDHCESRLHPCSNQAHHVCRSFNPKPSTLCEWCSFTDVIPNLSDASKVRRWAVAESAKRRLLWQLRDLSFPPFAADTGSTHPLRFEFKESVVDADGNKVDVTTGHQDGLITLDLAEADSVHRESMRVQLGEPQRTLIGHMRHEVGHYIDWSWASRVAKQEYCELFGDPDQVDYSQAMQRHYNEGPPTDWAERHVSAYATMHPWEDFAETVNAYLDMLAIAETANELGGKMIDLSAEADPKKLVAQVLAKVIEVSEYNFDLGLPALLPEKLSDVAVSKIAYVHRLRSAKLPSGSRALSRETLSHSAA